MDRIQRRLFWGGMGLCFVFLLGSLCYHFIWGWPFPDAVYMTIITLSTVGFKEVRPLVTTSQRLFTSALILSGVGLMFYTMGTLVEYLMEGEIEGRFWRRRMKNKIQKLRDHYIVCGFGRVGGEVARVLENARVPFVIIERAAEELLRARKLGYLCVEGDASSDAILREAGIERAKGLIAAAGNDAENIFIVLSARFLRPDLFIVARACHEEAESKLRSAGANRVIMPLRIGGSRMAMLALRPHVVDLIDSMLLSRNGALEVEEIDIVRGSPLVGKSVKEAEEIAQNASILAVRKRDGTLLSKPRDEVILEEGDVLIIIGRREQLREVEE